VDVSDLRKRIIRALDDARQESATRRSSTDQAAAAYARFLDAVAVPLLKQAQIVLKAERQLFDVHAPAGSARLASSSSAETFLEITLDTSGAKPQVLGRVSVTRGRQGVVVDEKPIAPGTPIEKLGEPEVAEFLLSAIPKLVVRS
jgi:hypothetical protein